MPNTLAVWRESAGAGGEIRSLVCFGSPWFSVDAPPSAPRHAYEGNDIINRGWHQHVFLLTLEPYLFLDVKTNQSINQSIANRAEYVYQ